ncbi:hypothetical protein ACFX1Q_022551 [Malus domestica]
MYVVHPDWLRPRNRRVLINCEGFTQVDVASSLEVLFLHPGGGIFNWWRCTRLGQAQYKPCSRSPPSRRARGSAERGDRQEYKAD